jgi:hypothetical protein
MQIIRIIQLLFVCFCCGNNPRVVDGFDEKNVCNDEVVKRQV